MMNVVDSSGWLEYFTDGANADASKSVIQDETHLIFPTVCLYEVFKITSSEKSFGVKSVRGAPNSRKAL